MPSHKTVYGNRNGSNRKHIRGKTEHNFPKPKSMTKKQFKSLYKRTYTHDPFLFDDCSFQNKFILI